MYFISWLIQRVKQARFEWVVGYRRLIIEEKFLSIVFTVIIGLFCWITPVGWICIHFIDHHATAEYTLLALALSVPLFWVYHWIMALYAIYREEQRSMWEELKR